jgi:hypothetical protein
MTKRRLAFLPCALFLTTFWVPAHAQPNPASPSYDIVIRGGRIIDGTGNPWYVGDIGIVGNRIVAIGKLSAEPEEGKGTFQSTGLRGVGFNAGRVIEAPGPGGCSRIY